MKYIFFCITLALASPAFAQDHRDVVVQVAAEQPPDHTLEGALTFLVRVVDRLNSLYPNERAGLLEKVDGENIIPYGGTLVSASRIAYPDQHLFKLLSDVPTTNRPQWVDDGFASIGGFLKGYLPVAGVPPTPMPPPIVTPPPVAAPPAPIFDPTALETAIANLRADVDAGRAENQQFYTEARDRYKKVAAFIAKYGALIAASLLGGKFL